MQRGIIIIEKSSIQKREIVTEVLLECIVCELHKAESHAADHKWGENTQKERGVDFHGEIDRADKRQ